MGRRGAADGPFRRCPGVDRAGDRDMWDEDDIAEHDELLDDISAKRAEIRDILREATGNPNLNF